MGLGRTLRDRVVSFLTDAEKERMRRKQAETRAALRKREEEKAANKRKELHKSRPKEQAGAPKPAPRPDQAARRALPAAKSDRWTRHAR